ncbi:MAG: hypothetical protein AAF806_07045 [Bacteroidota bacterium]
MRIFFCITLFLFGTVIMSAQDTKNLHFPFNQSTANTYKDQVRIHIFYNPDALIGYRLHTSLSEEGIRLRNNDYILLVTNEEQINFFRNTAVNNLPVQLDFERGKDYYFRINRSSDGVLMNNFMIDELNKRAFKMELFINNKEPKPEIYDFTLEET